MMSRSTRINKSAQRGFTIVEVLVSIFISVLILAGVVQIFLGSRQADNLSNSLARIQENGRFSMDLITRELRLVGFQGCRDPNTSTIERSQIVAQNFLFDNFLRESVNGVVAPSNTGTAAVSVNLLQGRLTIDDVVPGTDVLSIAYLSPASAVVAEDMADPGDPIKIVDNAVGFADSQPLAILRCKSENAGVFRISSIDTEADPIVIEHAASPEFNTTVELLAEGGSPTTFDKGDELRRVVHNVYFVRVNSQGIPALFRRTINGVAEELIPSVENFRVSYALYDANGSNNRIDDDTVRWVSADQISDDNWIKVNAIKVALLVRDETNVLPDVGPVDYNMLGQTVTLAKADRRPRQVLTSTTKIRNRDASRGNNNL